MGYWVEVIQSFHAEKSEWEWFDASRADHDDGVLVLGHMVAGEFAVSEVIASGHWRRAKWGRRNERP